LRFDPGHVYPKSFGVTVQKKNSSEILQRVSNTELIDTLSNKITDEMIRRSFHMDSVKAHDTIFNSAESVIGQPSLTVFDIAAWRTKRFQVKNPPMYFQGRWLRDVIEPIEATVTIKTSIVDKIEIPVRAFLVEPRILVVKDIDFGKVQIGTQAFSDVTVSNPFNHTLAIEFYIGRNYLKHTHLSEKKAYDFNKEFDKARIKAMRTNDNIVYEPTPSNPASEYAKRYRYIIDDFRATNKYSALNRLPFMKIWCDREEYKALQKRKEQDPGH
jgi:hypothetical protein